jgi:hypothetical protein
MATTTNYGWATPDDTSLVKDGAAAMRTLGSSIDTTTKALNPETTLGDIVYRSSTANVKTRLGIGSTGQVLTVASGVPSWATPAGGSGLTLVKTQTIGSAVSSVVVTDAFSATYDNYLILLSGGAHSTDNPNIRMQMGSTTTGYYCNGIQMFSGSTAVNGLAEDNAARWGFVARSSTNGLNGAITLISPYLANWTGISFVSSGMKLESSENGPQRTGQGFLANTTQYTGFTFDWLYGTATGGTIKIYGYANS